MALFSKGIMLTQNKEPALSGKLVSFINPQPQYMYETDEYSSDINELDQRDIIDIAKAAQIYDERDGRLLVSKLRRSENRAKVIIVDAIDDEPYVSSKINPMLNLSDELILGIQLCVKVAGTDNVEIKTYRHLGAINTSIPAKIGGYKVDRLKGGYPTFSQIRDKGQEGQIVVGVGALIHLARAVRYKAPQTTTFVTVAGNSISSPMNLEVSIGMNITEIVERCGLITTPNRLVVGGPMAGVSIINADYTVVTHTTRAILAFHGKNYDTAYSCIGCGRCEQNCPSGLNPMYIHQIMESKTYSMLPDFDPQYCIGCGTCSYVCPSRLNVVGSALKAKRLMNAKAEDKEDNDEV